MEVKTIAVIENGFIGKFGIPRQSGLTSAISRIVFEPEYRVAEALRGIEQYSHLWLIWGFSENMPGQNTRDNSHNTFRPTVRPPRLGGNQRVGVFATRSPFRPNPIGLSCVELVSVVSDRERGMFLTVRGCDLKNGTPIYDIKPYLPYADSHPEARGGFAEALKDRLLKVEMPHELIENMPENYRRELREILENDPRPSYQRDPERVYSFEYGEYAIGFKVVDGSAKVIRVEKFGK